MSQFFYREFSRRKSVKEKVPPPVNLKALVKTLNLALVPGDGDGISVGDHVLAHVGVKLFVATICTIVPQDVDAGEGDEAGAEVKYWTWPKKDGSPFIVIETKHFLPFSLMLCKLHPPQNISGSTRTKRFTFPCLHQSNSTRVLDWLKHTFKGDL